MTRRAILCSFVLLVFLRLLSPLSSAAAAFHNPYGKLPAAPTPGDLMFAEYLRQQTGLLAERTFAGVTNHQQWLAQRQAARNELLEMLGLQPMPEKTDLKPTITGVLEAADFTVEKLHFQSRPGLYVTANFYLPKDAPKPLPTILYVCGHASVKTNGVSYGCKVAYQHHGVWFARNGYACLVLDTVELGEIEGQHHGTYREGMWWWNSRGYSAAAAETWNCIRALDYLEQRPEVDKGRIGVTGRSGGGAYSWWIAAVDERIKAACPVAGITDLQNQVVDGVVEGHCDCMFMVNTYRWDYPKVAALVAPRPLLICNTDKDSIFPLDGVNRLHEKVRAIYDLYGASDKLGLLITEGGHKDTQDLQVPVMRWFNRFLKGEQTLVQNAAVPMFSGQQLKVFDQLPEDQITSRCYENFTQLAEGSRPLDSREALATLRQKTFGGWPECGQSPALKKLTTAQYAGVRLEVNEFESEPGIVLRVYVVQPAESIPKAIWVEALDEPAWRAALRLGAVGFRDALKEECALAGVTDGNGGDSSRRLEEACRYLREHDLAYVGVAPRGIGFSALTESNPYRIHIRRRFMQLGQTLAGMQVWDLRRAIQAVKHSPGLAALRVMLSARPEMTEVAAFASLFEDGITTVRLPHAPRSDKEAPDFLNWSRIITPTQLLSLTKERCEVQITGGNDVH